MLGYKMAPVENLEMVTNNVFVFGVMSRESSFPTGRGAIVCFYIKFTRKPLNLKEKYYSTNTQWGKEKEKSGALVQTSEVWEYYLKRWCQSWTHVRSAWGALTLPLPEFHIRGLSCNETDAPVDSNV
jgi:hypothetical protein